MNKDEFLLAKIAAHAAFSSAIKYFAACDAIGSQKAFLVRCLWPEKRWTGQGQLL